MTDKELKSKIADIIMEAIEEYNSNEINRPMIASVCAGEILDSLQEEPVSEELEDAAYNFVMDNYGNPKESLFLFDQRCFRAGAKWQKQRSISKAMEWLLKHSQLSDWQFRKLKIAMED